MEIDIKNIKAAYETATESEKTLLSTLFPDLSLGHKEEKPVTERIKTFEDAAYALGNSHPFVKEWRMGVDPSPDLEAYLQLRIICAALNEGWKPRFTGDEYRYTPWFRIYTKKGYEKLDEDEKKRSCVVYQSSYIVSAVGGMSYVFASDDAAYTFASIGSRLVLKTKELAEYCGRQFIDLWADYLLWPQQANNNEIYNHKKLKQ